MHELAVIQTGEFLSAVRSRFLSVKVAAVLEEDCLFLFGDNSKFRFKMLYRVHCRIYC